MDEGTSGRIKITAAVVVLLSSGYYAWRNLAASSVTDDANRRMYLCTETGKAFPHEMVLGETQPIMSPYSKKNTAYEAERCYWKKDASGQWKAKRRPTYVVLNMRLGKTDPTICPDCGHEVVGHNPRPPKELMETADEE